MLHYQLLIIVTYLLSVLLFSVTGCSQPRCSSFWCCRWTSTFHSICTTS